MKNNIETIKKNQPEMRNTISQIRNTLEGINSRQDEAEDQISVLENKVVENIQTDQNKEKRFIKNKDSLDVAGVAQWTKCQPANQRVTDLISKQGTCLGCWSGCQ